MKNKLLTISLLAANMMLVFSSDTLYAAKKTIINFNGARGLKELSIKKLKSPNKNPFGLVYENAITENIDGKVNIHPVNYRLNGNKISANIYTPAGYNKNSSKKYPTIVIAHPNGGIKEQVDQKEQSELDSHHREEAMNRIKELQDFISEQETDITEFDEALVKKLIEKITVFNDHFTVEFKSGITINIEA